MALPGKQYRRFIEITIWASPTLLRCSNCNELWHSTLRVSSVRIKQFTSGRRLNGIQEHHTSGLHRSLQDWACLCLHVRRCIQVIDEIVQRVNETQVEKKSDDKKDTHTLQPQRKKEHTWHNATEVVVEFDKQIPRLRSPLIGSSLLSQTRSRKRKHGVFAELNRT